MICLMIYIQPLSLHSIRKIKLKPISLHKHIHPDFCFSRCLSLALILRWRLSAIKVLLDLEWGITGDNMKEIVPEGAQIIRQKSGTRYWMKFLKQILESKCRTGSSLSKSKPGIDSILCEKNMTLNQCIVFELCVP